jgi:hypothetical protein
VIRLGLALVPLTAKGIDHAPEFIDLAHPTRLVPTTGQRHILNCRSALGCSDVLGSARLYASAMRNSPWSGPSGDEFARLIGERLRGVAGLTVEVRQIDPAVATPASFLVDVHWPADRGVLCEVADSIDTVRVMDDHGEDVSIDAALRYLEARAAGTSRRGAWRYAAFE